MTTMNIFEMTDTWNDAGTTFKGIGLAVTDTASQSGSNLIHLTHNTADRFWISNANTAYLKGLLTLDGGVEAINRPVLHAEVEWNGDGNQHALVLDVTDTASDQLSTLLDLRTGTTSQFTVYKNGASRGRSFTAVDHAVTANAPILDLYQTWNEASTSFTGIYTNVTDTASASNSMLMMLDVGYDTKFSIRKDGAVTHYGPMSMVLGESPASIINASQTWNVADGSFGALTINIDDVASQADARLMTFVVNSVERFAVDKTGYVLGRGLGVVSHTVTANRRLIDLNQTWNNAAETFHAIRLTVVDQASQYGMGTLIDLSSEDGSGNSNAAFAIRSDGTLRHFFRSGSTYPETEPVIFNLQWQDATQDFNGIVLNIIDDASSAASNALLIRDAWSEKFSVRKDGAVTLAKTLTTGLYAVAGLPLPGAAGAGARAMVSDASVTTFGSVVTGGGSNFVPVYSDGTDWRVG